MKSMPQFVLASASPRRRAILENLGLTFEVLVSDASETHPENTDPADIVRILAERKAHFAAEMRPEGCIIAADTMVLFDGRLLGKPKDRAEAFSMLKSLSGKCHTVLSGVCIEYGGRVYSGTAETEVFFRELSDADIASYVDTGLSDGKAGGYGIQDLGAYFVREIRGDYYNVVGLPIHLLTDLLCRAGCSISQLISKGNA